MAKRRDQASPNGRPDSNGEPTPDPPPFERFEDLTRRLLRVPKKELNEKLKQSKR